MLSSWLFTGRFGHKVAPPARGHNTFIERLYAGLEDEALAMLSEGKEEMKGKDAEDAAQDGFDCRQPCADGFAPIHIAAAKGLQRVLSFLVEKEHVDVNEPGPKSNTPLHLAVHNSQLGAVDVLVKLGADISLVNDDNKTPVNLAHTKSDKEKKELNRLLYPLHAAAEAGDVDAVITLISGGKGVEETDMNCMTPLHIAVGCKLTENLEVVQALMANDADPFKVNRLGTRPIDLCHSRKVQQLICDTYGARSSAANGEGSGGISEPEHARKRERGEQGSSAEASMAVRQRREPDVFQKHDHVVYRSSDGTFEMKGEVLKVHLDDIEPYYTVRLRDGAEKNTDAGHLRRLDGMAVEEGAVSQDNDKDSLPAPGATSA